MTARKPAAKTAGKTKTAPKAKPAKATKPAPAAAPLKAADAVKREAPPPIEIAMLALDQLIVGDLNPRKTFNDIEIAELADSIAAMGLLQNLVVRPNGKAGKLRYEVMVGGKRYRALQLLAAAGKWDAAAPLVPCNVKPHDDGANRAVAIIENIQRSDVPPMEEATKIAELHAINPDHWSTANIAAAIGKTQRYVQTRIALAQRLHPSVKKALAANEITLRQARIFLIAPPDEQARTLKQAKQSPWLLRDEDDLRGHLVETQFDTAAAVFDPVLCDGGTVTDEETGKTYFANPDAAHKLQEAAITKRLDELKEKYPWAEYINASQAGGYEKVKAGDKDAGAVVFAAEGQMHVLAPVISQDTRIKRNVEAARGKDKGAGKKGGKPDAKPATEKRLLTDAQSIAVHEAKTRAIRAGMAVNSHVAMAAACLAWLQPHSEIAIRDDVHQKSENDFKLTAADKAHLTGLLGKAAPLFKSQGGSDYGWADSALCAEQLAALVAFDPLELPLLFAFLVAQRCGSWFHTSKSRVGDSQLAIALAGATNAATHLPDYWHPDKDYFAAYPSKEPLARLLRRRRLGDGALDDAKKSDLVKACAKVPAATWHPNEFPETNFQTDTQAKKAAAAPPPTPKAKAKAAKPPKASPEPTAAPGDMVGVGKLIDASEGTAGAEVAP